MQTAHCSRGLGLQGEELYFQLVCKMQKPLNLSSKSQLNTIRTQLTGVEVLFGCFICIQG